MGRLYSKTFYMCFGSFMTICFLRFMGYFQPNVSEVRYHDLKDVQSSESQIPKVSSETTNTVNGLPVMNISIYRWHPRDLIRMPLPNYIPGLKTPCFFIEDDGSSSESKGAVRVSEKLVLRCLPQLLLIGVERCATGSMFRRLTLHRHVLYPTVHGRALKEPLFFNGVVGMDLHRQTMGGYLQLMNTAARVIYEKCMKGTTVVPPEGYKECPYILVDFSVRNMHHNWFWHKDLENQGLPEPNVLVPHKVYRLNPKMKVLVMIRNPPDRLYSDYRAYPSSHEEITTPEDFHKRVLGEIAVWNECLNTKRLPFNRCAYGFNWPEGFSGGTTIDFWLEPSMDRLRVCIYFAYLKDWIKVFPRENILVFTIEEYTLGPEDLIQRALLPFAELDDYGEHERPGLDMWENFDRATNRTPERLMMSETREVLERFYQPYNLQLAELMGDNKYLWSEFLQFVK